MALAGLIGPILMAGAAKAQSTGGSNPTSGSSVSTVLLALAINAVIAAVEVAIFLVFRARFPKVGTLAGRHCVEISLVIC